ncbi:MAG TPA: hypothetical protein PLM24_05610 [Methanothrix sp.]|nr:hypothetical protein [Methanothrix sp.]HPJ84013.1 hypothetical protein [Methanothrix sp.]HPR66597.1 hypothetical protein [Methanothrix sp.]
MVGEFALAVERWTDFYVLVGSAAFTLLGLIFVAVSINLDLIAKPAKSEDLTAFSSQIYLNFLAITLISLVFMIPRQNPYGLGIPLLLIGLLEMSRTVRLWKKFEFGDKEQRLLDVNQFRKRLLIPNTLCYLVLIFVSVSLLYGTTQYLYWMTMVVLWILLAGSLSAWILMLRLAALGKESKTNE